MNELDRILIEAYERCIKNGRRDRYVDRPIRSWSLALRAGDTRIIAGIAGEDETEEIELTGSEVRELCEPIAIDPPGVPIVEAARRFGVSPHTIRRWEKKGLLKIQRFVGKHQAKSIGRARGRAGSPDLKDARSFPYARRFPVLNMALVTTCGVVMPGGEVWSMPWGQARGYIHQRIPMEFSQSLVRAHRAMGVQRKLWQWVCPVCGSMVFKVFWPMRVWTIGALVGKSESSVADGFSCRKCSRLVYESAERRAGERAWNYFIHRISDGVLNIAEVFGEGFMRTDL